MIDARSLKNILTLDPKAQPLAVKHLELVNERLRPTGLVMKVISGTRTYAEQNALYAKGRTVKGPKVTNARGGFSNHNFGIAWDLGLFDSQGNYIPESTLYRVAGTVGRELGLEWGGSWVTFTDEPHFQIKTGLTLAQMRERVAKGIPVL